MASGAELAMILKAKDEASGVFDKVKGSAGGLTSGLGSMVSGLAGVGAAVGGLTMLATGIAGAATSMISGNAQMETYQTQLGTLMGSADAAKERIKQLAQIGAETPFELTQLVSAEKVMMGFGLTSEKTMQLTGKSLDQYRTSMGDMAAGTGTDLTEITTLWAKFGSGATGESLARLQELGIVTKEQLAGVGIEFSKSGELLSPLPVAMAAAMKIADEKFGGGMKALSATFDGQMSTLSDNFNQAKTLLMQPIFEVLKSGLSSVNEFLSSPAFQTGLTDFATAGAAAIQTLIDVMGGLIGIFQGTDEGIDAIYDGFQGLLSDDAIGNLINIVYSLGETFRAVMDGDIPAAVAGVTQVLSDFGSLIATLVEDWARAFASWVDGADSEMMSSIGDILLNVTAWIFESSLAIIEKLGTWAAAFVDWIGPKLPDMLRALGSFVAGLLEYVGGDALPLLISKLVEWGTAFVEWVAPKIPPMLAELAVLLGELVGWLIGTALPGIIGKLVQWGDAFTAWVAPQIPGLLAALGGLALQLLGWIAAQIVLINVQLALWGVAFIQWVATDVLPALPGALAQIASSILGWITSTAGTMLGAAASIGRAIIDGIANAITAGVGAIRSAAINAAESALNAAKSALGIESPSRVFSQEVGLPIVQGLALGIRNNGGLVADAAMAMAEAARQAAMASVSKNQIGYSAMMGALGATMGQGVTPVIPTRQFGQLASGSIIPGLNNTPSGSIPIGPGTVKVDAKVYVGTREMTDVWVETKERAERQGRA